MTKIDENRLIERLKALRSEIRGYQDKLDNQLMQVEQIVREHAGTIPAVCGAAASEVQKDKKGIVASLTSTNEKIKTLKAQANSYRASSKNLDRRDMAL